MYGTLYPTVQTNNGIAVTDFIQNLSPANDIAHNYFIGYIPEEEFPYSVAGFTSPTISEDNTTIKLNNFVRENHPFGFVYRNTVSGGGAYYPFQAYWLNTNYEWALQRSQEWSYLRLINNIRMANMAVEDSIKFRMNCCIVLNTDLDENLSGVAKFKNSEDVFWDDITISLSDLRNFVNGNGTISAHLSGSVVSGLSINFDHTFSYSDFDEENMTAMYTDGDYTIFTQIYTFWIAHTGKYTNPENSELSTAYIIPFLRSHAPDGLSIPEQDFMYTPYNRGMIEGTTFRFYKPDNQPQATVFVANTNDPTRPDVSYSTNFGRIADYLWRGKFPLDNVVAAEMPNLYGQAARKFIVNGCLFGACLQNYGTQFTLKPAISFKDLLKVIMLRNACISGASSADLNNPHTTYTQDDYVSYFTTDETPYYSEHADPMTWGAAGDTALVSGILRPWQLPGGNITDSEFNVDDMPEYEPPEDDTRGTGFWHLNNTYPFGGAGGFITQYALTSSQLSQFGNYLWAAFLDDEFLDSIGVIFNESLSLNPSDILNYIVSIRMYPFDIPSQTTSLKVYIGRGIRGIPIVINNVPTTVHIVNDLCISKSSNWTYIPAHHEDFRDYESVSRITLYVPFCGCVELTPSQVVDSYIRLTYTIDLSTGACQAAIECRYSGSQDTFIIDTLNGQMGATLQLSASNLSQVIQKGVGFATQVAATIALAAVGAGEVAAGTESAFARSSIEAAMVKNYQEPFKYASVAERAGKSIISSVSTISGVASPTFGQTSGFSNMQVTIPCIQVIYRHYEIPKNYGHVYGYPCNKTMKLSQLEGQGFTVCKNPDLSGVPASYDELVVLRSLLESGVYL